MTKEELISKVAQQSGQAKGIVAKVFDATFESLSQALEKGERVLVPGFGVFSVATRKERKGRNPRTGKEIKIPARKVVRFSMTKKLKERVK